MDGAFKNILVPMDFSLGSSQALTKAVVLARQCNAASTLLYVMDLNGQANPTGPANPGKLQQRLFEEGRRQLEQTIQQLAEEQVAVRTLIQEGLPCETICEAARQSDLIVLGKSKPKSFWHWFSRRTVGAVLEKAPCPVLVVRAQKPREPTN